MQWFPPKFWLTAAAFIETPVHEIQYKSQYSLMSGCIQAFLHTIVSLYSDF